MSGLRGLAHSGVVAAKRVWYAGRGEPVTYGEHTLRFVPGTRPVRAKYATSEDGVARNDARQILYFVDRVKPGQTVLDIGAHVGQYAVLFGALVGPSGTVISFEPDSATHDVMRRNLRLNAMEKRVKIESLAVFDKNGEHVFFSHGGNAQSSLTLTALFDAAQFATSSVVHTVRIDDYIRERGLRTPSFVKLDVEGAEIAALRGAPELLASRDTVIVCELHPYAWGEMGGSFDDILAMVASNNKSIRYLDDRYQVADGARYGAVIIE